MAEAGVLGDLNEGLGSVGETFSGLFVTDVGEAAVEAAEAGEIECVAFIILLFASSRIESMVTSRGPVVVSSAKIGKENAGTKLCDAEAEENEEAIGRLSGYDCEKVFSYSPT